MADIDAGSSSPGPRQYRMRLVIEFSDFDQLTEDQVRALMRLFDIKNATVNELEGLRTDEAIQSLLPWDDILTRLNSVLRTDVERDSMRFGALNGRLRLADLEELQERARDLSLLYAPIRFVKFEFDLPDPDNQQATLVALATELTRDNSRAPHAAQVYVERPPAEPPLAVPPEVPNTQEHLRAAPLGIDAEHAWSLPGGMGEEVGYADIEYGWNLDHPDLPAIDARYEGEYTFNDDAQAFRDHGTGMLGLVSAQHNGLYGRGIAPRARAHVVSQLLSLDTADLPGAIELAATKYLEQGDVLLLEAQTVDDPSSPNPQFLPVEVERAVFSSIRFATTLGVIVVEPAGNSGVDLDAVDGEQDLGYLSPPFNGRFMNRSTWDAAQTAALDSGAIMAAAAVPTPENGVISYRRWNGSNYGSRIDCFAHGHNRVGSLTGDLSVGFIQTTGGTSAAAAIVAGAAALIQSIYKARFTDGSVLSPAEIRDLLRNSGTPASAAETTLIGHMPDLRGIEGQIKHAAPLELKPKVPPGLGNLGKVLFGSSYGSGPTSTTFPRIVTMRAERH